MLDEFHAAAAAADEERYFATLAPTRSSSAPPRANAGQAESFRDVRALATSRAAKGWSVRAVGALRRRRARRHARPGSTGPSRTQHYGACRGCGVSAARRDEWRVAYNLTIPSPTRLAPELVDQDPRNAPGKIRTCDLCLRRAALYPLSYGRGDGKSSCRRTARSRGGGPRRREPRRGRSRARRPRRRRGRRS